MSADYAVSSSESEFGVVTDCWAVFKYDFRAPGDDNDYTIMWDYNIGLVRMTPFFKCCQYGKVSGALLGDTDMVADIRQTMPAKMLNMNPGLKDITHSITGGAILAQGKLSLTPPRTTRRNPRPKNSTPLTPPGYWMPYSCAKAVCSTFCYKIAGALIPIFGPSFPSLCTRPDSPDYGRMIIDPALVREAAREAEANRRHHHALHVPRGVHSATSSPRRGTPRSTPDGEHYQGRAALQHQATLGMYSQSSCTSPYNTDSDEGIRPSPDSAPGSWSPGGGGYLCTSAPARVNSGWTPANRAAAPAHHSETQQLQPWASSVPRFAPGGDPRLRPWKGHAGKRYVEEEVERGYEGGAESQANSPEMGSAGKGGAGEGGQGSQGKGGEGGEGAIKEGAMLLLGFAGRKGDVECAERAVEELHRSKRRRDSPE